LTAQINRKRQWERESEAEAHTTGQPEQDTPKRARAEQAQQTPTDLQRDDR